MVEWRSETGKEGSQYSLLYPVSYLFGQLKLNPLGNSGTQSRTRASVLPSLRGKGARVFIHQLSLFAERCSVPGHPWLPCTQAEKALLAGKASSHGH